MCGRLGAEKFKRFTFRLHRTLTDPDLQGGGDISNQIPKKFLAKIFFSVIGHLIFSFAQRGNSLCQTTLQPNFLLLLNFTPIFSFTILSSIAQGGGHTPLPKRMRVMAG